MSDLVDSYEEHKKVELISIFDHLIIALETY